MNLFQDLAAPNDTEDTVYDVSDTSFHKLANEKVIVITTVEKKEIKPTVILGNSIVKRIQKQKLGRKFKQNVIMRSFPGAKLDCMSNHAISTVKSNPDRIMTHCGTNDLNMDERPEAIAEKTIKLAKSVKLPKTEVILSIIIPCKEKLADKESKVNKIVENFCKEDETIKFMRQKSLDVRKRIGKDGMYLNHFTITEIVKNFTEFPIMPNILIFEIQ